MTMQEEHKNKINEIIISMREPQESYEQALALLNSDITNKYYASALDRLPKVRQIATMLLHKMDQIRVYFMELDEVKKDREYKMIKSQDQIVGLYRKRLLNFCFMEVAILKEMEKA